MNKSESIKNITVALVAAQGELQNPHFDSFNPHFKSKFASLKAVRAAVVPVFAKHGLNVSQWPITEGRYAGCVTLLAHISGEFTEEKFLVFVERETATGYAAAVSYAKRIALQAVAAIVGEEDSDGEEASGATLTAEKLTELKKGLEDAAKTGLKAMQTAWAALPVEAKVALKDLKETLKHKAADVDAKRAA